MLQGSAISLIRARTGSDSISWMSGGLAAFCAVPQGGDRVRLYVTGRDASVRSRIGVVAFRWGERPKVVGISPQPVLDLGEPGAFDMDGVGYPWVVENGGEVWMYYVGWNRLNGDVPFRNQVGLAVSRDGGETFKRFSRAPLLPLHPDQFSWCCCA